MWLFASPAVIIGSCVRAFFSCSDVDMNIVICQCCGDDGGLFVCSFFFFVFCLFFLAIEQRWGKCGKSFGMKRKGKVE